MLNYDVNRDDKNIELLESEIRGVGLENNPFPGLRPFGIDECHLFFGREGQVDEVLMKLSQNRFVSVMGFSGSGKSSLMYCGLIPVLYGGFMTSAGPNWKVVVTRPGIAPLDNMAEALLRNDEDFQNMGEEDRIIKHTVTSSILRSGVKGLVDLAKNIQEEKGENLLILVDQFEELFRFYRESDSSTDSNESAMFINMLLEAIKQEEVPIYLALTMRSEFIGDCAQFPGLTEMINLSNYLVPQMTREQKRMAVEGPVAVGGSKISPRLVKRILNDVGEQQDQLPVLQHALMRSWNYWAENRESGELLDIRHYNAIGKLSGALSQHANEAFDELDDKQKLICETLFKTVTEKSDDNIGVRRPTRLSEIAEIAGVSEEEVVEVVDHFRSPERSLIMPAAHVELKSDSIIEISHESLIRIWTRLKNWVEEEHESAEMYRRLSEAAEMYQIGRTGLWRPPDLQLALNWQKKQNPTRVWAQRYNEAFERAIVFLDTSRITYEAEQRNQEMTQKKALRTARIIALVLSIAAIILIIFFLIAVSQTLQAEQEKKAALDAQAAAEVAEGRATDALQEAIIQTRLANREKVRASIQSEIAKAQGSYAQYQAGLAREAQDLAEQRLRQANEATARAELEFQRAQTNFELAQEANRNVERLLHLSAAQSMSVKSTNVGDNNLQSLLAQQAFMFNQQYGGKPYDAFIYDGLYEAVSTYEGDTYNKFYGHKDGVRAVAFNPTSLEFYSAGSDGTVRGWNIEDTSVTDVLSETGTHPNRTIQISPDGAWMAMGSDSSAINLLNLETGATRTVSGHKSAIYDIKFSNVQEGFYSLSHDRSIRFYDFRNSGIVRNFSQHLKSFDVDGEDKFIVAGSDDGKLIKFDMETKEEVVILDLQGNPIHSVDISPDNSVVAFGDETGFTHLFNLESQEEFSTLRGHNSRVNIVKFNNTGTMLATGSFDGSMQLYQMDDLNELPIVMQDHDSYVWDLAFSEDGNYVVAATNSEVLKIWPTNPEFFARDMCERLDRNITIEEWEAYVPQGVNYRTTCDALDEKQTEGGE